MKEILSLTHPLVKHLVKLRKNRKYRTENSHVVIAGKKLVKEVCNRHIARTVLLERNYILPESISAQEVYSVTPEVMKKVSGLETPECILAEVPIPSQEILKGKRYIVAFDGIADPGNMGTLWRTALALGWEGVFVLDNSVDPFNDKTLRSAKGATFRLPYRLGNFSEFVQLVEENHLQALLGDVKGVKPSEITDKTGKILVLANEANGPSEAMKKYCQRVTVEMKGDMESLNVGVAGGILMYLLNTEGRRA
jgi:RNA methyltransferase, TrmH family